MGWSGGTRIFDKMVHEILDKSLDEETTEALIETLVDVLEEADWDTQADSQFFDSPWVGSVFRRRNPEWFEDEED